MTGVIEEYLELEKKAVKDYNAHFLLLQVGDFYEFFEDYDDLLDEEDANIFR